MREKNLKEEIGIKLNQKSRKSLEESFWQRFVNFKYHILKSDDFSNIFFVHLWHINLCSTLKVKTSHNCWRVRNVHTSNFFHGDYKVSPVSFFQGSSPSSPFHLLFCLHDEDEGGRKRKNIMKWKECKNLSDSMVFNGFEFEKKEKDKRKILEYIIILSSSASFSLAGWVYRDEENVHNK